MHPVTAIPSILKSSNRSSSLTGLTCRLFLGGIKKIEDVLTGLSVDKVFTAARVSVHLT